MLIISLLALVIAPAAALAQFEFRDLDFKSVELTENGAPVYVYNYGTMLKEGAAPDLARCCYLHPVYAPNGVVITDDFPEDHPHHRGISWMWPVVVVDGRTYDLWNIKGIVVKFEEWRSKRVDSRWAELAVQNGWYVGDRKVVEEVVAIVTVPAAHGRRGIDITVALRSVGAQVDIGGTHEFDECYGGPLEIRFAPRTDTKIRTATQGYAPDSDLVPAAWAELTGNFGGKIVTANIRCAPNNPGLPNGWCLRHYGFLGVEYPGLELRRLSDDAPLIMAFDVSLFAGPSAAALPSKHVLVGEK